MIRIFIDFIPDGTGRGNFAGRLINALEDLGAECSFSWSGCDVALGFSTWKTQTKLPKVLRLDGILFYDTNKQVDKRKKVLASINNSDMVIYQSEFSMKILSEYFGIEKPYSIIYNGADLSKSDSSGNAVFIASQYIYNRTPEKRIPELLSIAADYVSLNSDITFYVAGHCANLRRTSKRIKLLGFVDNSELKKMLRDASVLLTGSYFGWCENTIVEALTTGVPVICFGGHGSEELVKTDGYVIKQDEITVDKLKSNIIPPINRDEVICALDTVLSTKYNIYRPDLDIKNIAKKYYEVLNSACQ